MAKIERHDHPALWAPWPNGEPAEVRAAYDRMLQQQAEQRDAREERR